MNFVLNKFILEKLSNLQTAKRYNLISRDCHRNCRPYTCR